LFDEALKKLVVVTVTGLGPIQIPRRLPCGFLDFQRRCCELMITKQYLQSVSNENQEAVAFVIPYGQLHPRSPLGAGFARIPMIVASNICLHAMIAWGPAENLALYKLFFYAFHILPVNRREFILEAGLGPTLLVLCQRHSMRNKACLCHLLAS
jgi:hypothetical protein